MISLSICLCLTLMLSIMASRSRGPSILLQMAKFTFLLWLNNIPLYVYTPIFSIHLLMGTCCFPLLTAMNKHCNTHGIPHLFDILFPFPLGIYPEVDLLDHMAVLFLISGETSILFSIGTVSFIFQGRGSNCLRLFFLESLWEQVVVVSGEDS